MDDAELVERAREGDERALDLLVRTHHSAAYRVAARILGDDDRAADAAQDAFIKAFRALDRFRGDASFRTWLLTIVSNEARGALRTSKRRNEVAIDDVAPVADCGRDASEMVESRAEVDRVRVFVQRLPEKQRLAVTLRLDEGLSFREVGAVIGSSEGSARVNYHHGLRRLRQMLEGT